MQYHKFKIGNTFIEFHNNWLGEETVVVNGQVVSKKSSIWGTSHRFSVIESGERAKYVVTSKFDGLQVLLDLRRNGLVLEENVVLRYGTATWKPRNKEKENGIRKLKAYELEEALAEFTKALDLDADDPEVYFHMACAYSVLERSLEAFECLRLAVKNGLQHTEAILTHDMLAFVRINEAFEGFLHSNFSEYDREQIR